MSDLDTKPRDAPSTPAPRGRKLMDRFIDTIELIAAIFVGIVAANIFIAVLLRNLFSTAIPDSYNIGQYLLGILRRPAIVAPTSRSI
jgi:TRAP-type transport system small permease protein